MKKLLSIAVLLIILVTGSIVLAEDEPQNTELAMATNPTPGKLYVAFTFAGERVKVEGLRHEGKVYLPVRETFEKAGGRVFWYGGQDQQICLLAGQLKVFLDLREEVFLQNGRPLTIKGTDFYMQNGRAYVPVESIIDMLGLR